MARTATAPLPPHHPGCSCYRCRIYRSSMAYGEAATLADFITIDDVPGGQGRPGNARYVPRKPLLVLVSAVIGRTPETSKGIYGVYVPGTMVLIATLEMPLALISNGLLFSHN